jgi:hypothetical protein
MRLLVDKGILLKEKCMGLQKHKKHTFGRQALQYRLALKPEITAISFDLAVTI